MLTRMPYIKGIYHLVYSNYGVTKRNVNSEVQTLKVRHNTECSTFHILCGLRYKCEIINLGKCALHLEQ